MKQILYLVFLTTMAISTHGQQCTCKQKFEFIKHEIETNYAGYHDKVNPKTRKEYNKVTRECLIKVNETKNDGYCLTYLLDWLGFFKDGHVQLYNPVQPNMEDTAAINQRIKKTEIITLSPDKLSQLEQGLDRVEGIYYYFDSSYKIAVVKSKNEFRDYAGVILSSKYNQWRPGQVKLELKKKNDSLFRALLYMRDHSYHPQMYFFSGSSFDGGNWKKLAAKEETAKTSFSDFKKVQAKKLSDSTFYIQIGTFNLSNAKAIDSVITANKTTLETMPNLIIDVRQNGGGGDAAFQPLMPYLYTGPIIGDGNEVYATSDNIKRWEEVTKSPDLPQSVKEEIMNMVKDMKAKPGGFVVSAKDDTFTTGKTTLYPKKVVILINKRCASTTEEFLLAARQSSKVTLIGEHTSGTLDYSNILTAESPCSDIEFGYSSTRSIRVAKGNGIDNIGIKPAILLSPGKDWVEEARKYLEK